MRSNRNILFSRSFHSLGVILLVVFGGLSFGVTSVHADDPLSQEALVAVVKPSIVRIAEHVTGTAKIPQVKVDIRKHLMAVIPDKYTEVPVDEYLVGSGFVIQSDGYIATNAHVVSLQTIEETLAADSALAGLYADALVLSDAEMQDFLQSETENGFSREVVKYVKTQSQFDLKNEIAVLRPDSSKKTIPELLSDGLPATIVSANDNFLEDKKDVAIIKIDESHLPALILGASESLVVGKKAFIFGFPATAEFNQSNSLQATFTQGVISAIKQSENSQFKLFQTDAKVSEGSSGGPLFDEQGAVVGMITFQTDELNRTQGDNFAFALPIELVKDAAAQAGITPLQGLFGENFKKGFQFFVQKKCDTAGTFFHSAVSESNNAFVTEGSVAPYLKKCDELQKAGLALNTRLDRFNDTLRTLGKPFLYLAGIGALFIGIFVGALFWVLRQVRREEDEINTLETRLRADEDLLKQYDTQKRKKERVV